MILAVDILSLVSVLGGLTVGGLGIVSGIWSRRHETKAEREQWTRDRRLDAYSTVVGLFSTLPDSETDGKDDVRRLDELAIGISRARMIASPEVGEVLDPIIAIVDRNISEGRPVITTEPDDEFRVALFKLTKAMRDEIRGGLA